MVELREVLDPDEIPLIRSLFLEYAAALGVDLSFQSFDEELAGLPGAYAPPAGHLLIAFEESHPIGCVALRAIDPETAELKRLYVRPEGRGRGAGRKLAISAIKFARTAGYRRIRLDTLPSMNEAAALYESLGFVDIPAYRHNPVAGTRFMELILA